MTRWVRPRPVEYQARIHFPSRFQQAHVLFSAARHGMLTAILQGYLDKGARLGETAQAFDNLGKVFGILRMQRDAHNS